jgi:hypothetical protein
LGASDTVERRAERVEVRQFIEGPARNAGRLAHHLQRDPLGAVRNLWDYRRSTPPSKVLVTFGTERHGRKAFGTGRGPPIHRGRHQQRRALGAPPSTRPARYCTHFLGLPTIDASYLGTSQDWDRATRSKGDRNGSRSANLSRAPARSAGRLAHHLQRDPLGTVRKFWDYRVLIPSSEVLIKIGIERHGRKAIGTGRGPPIYPGRRRDAHHL